jgi:hypothetical protein
MGPMRTPARVLGLALAFVVTFVAGSAAAWADTPASPAWPAPKHDSHLDLLLLFGGSTVGLFVLISLFALLTARRNYVPPAPGNEVVKPSGDAPVRH